MKTKVFGSSFTEFTYARAGSTSATAAPVTPHEMATTAHTQASYRGPAESVTTGRHASAPIRRTWHAGDDHVKELLARQLCGGARSKGPGCASPRSTTSNCRELPHEKCSG